MDNASIKKLEADLWESADLLRAGSKLTSNQYCMPVLGLLFLRYAYSRYKMVEEEILKDRPVRNGRKMPVEASDFTAKSALFLPEMAQFDYLVNLPENVASLGLLNVSGQNREVWLEGEAYFKVAKNEKQPFVVKTENMDVRVLGTEFNLKAYADEKWVQATLVRGEVAVFTGMDKSVRNTLKPEQQAEWDIEKGKLDVKTVELDLYIAWKNGQFVFRGQRLTEIMTVLERWYDFEVCYQADWIKEVEFAGKLNRSASIEPILDVIRSTHKINVNTRGKTIVFSAKQ